MNTPDDINVLHRLSKNLQTKTKDLGDRVRTRSPSVYTDPQRYEQELQKIFREQPVVVGHSSQAPNSGDFFTAEIAGLPILVARGEDGVLKAMINSCVHRAAIVENRPSGTAASFTCPYHGWSYKLNGRLFNVTDHTSFEGCDLNNTGMQRLPVAEKHGLVFVRATPGDDRELSIDLGDIGKQFDTFGFADLELFRTEKITLKFNWKLEFDASLETYHANYIHANTGAPIINGMATIFDFCGPHTRFMVPKRSMKNIPLEELSITPIRTHVLPNYMVFPNASISFPEDHAFMLSVFPDGVGSCQIVYAMVVPKGEAVTKAKHWDRTFNLTRSVISEDFQTLETVHRAYAGGFNMPAIFGKYEHAIGRFHDICDELVGSKEQ